VTGEQRLLSVNNASCRNVFLQHKLRQQQLLQNVRRLDWTVVSHCSYYHQLSVVKQITGGKSVLYINNYSNVFWGPLIIWTQRRVISSGVNC